MVELIPGLMGPEDLVKLLNMSRVNKSCRLKKGAQFGIVSVTCNL